MTYVATLGRFGFPARMARTAKRMPSRSLRGYRSRLGDDGDDLLNLFDSPTSYTPAPTNYVDPSIDPYYPSAPIPVSGNGLATVLNLPVSTPVYSPIATAAAPASGGINWGNITSQLLTTAGKLIAPGGSTGVATVRPGTASGSSILGSSSGMLLIVGAGVALVMLMMAMRK